MTNTAKVISVKGQLAKITVERSSMCDGCSKKGCSGSCGAGSLMGASKNMTAEAYNAAEAKVGDVVTVETSDGKVLSYALLVFILPIAVCAALYAAVYYFIHDERISLAFSGAGFIFTFAIIGIIERIHKKKKPDIVITGIISSDREYQTKESEK